MSNLLITKDRLLGKKEGFTLIEIVLVLAIAGLLLVIVFLAVSGAQKSRRDTQRKNDNARLLSQLEQYASNNSGAYPTTAAQLAPYLPSNFNDPTTGGAYNVLFNNAACPTWGGGPAEVHITVAGRTATTRMCLEQGFQTLTNN